MHGRILTKLLLKTRSTLHRCHCQRHEVKGQSSDVHAWQASHAMAVAAWPWLLTSCLWQCRRC